jgi:hypothetical protein
LMIIFMFIAINYILQIIEHTFIEEDIYNKIETEFKEEIANNDIELGPDGAIRFICFFLKHQFLIYFLCFVYIHV